MRTGRSTCQSLRFVLLGNGRSRSQVPIRTRCCITRLGSGMAFAGIGRAAGPGGTEPALSKRTILVSVTATVYGFARHMTQPAATSPRPAPATAPLPGPANAPKRGSRDDEPKRRHGLRHRVHCVHEERGVARRLAGAQRRCRSQNPLTLPAENPTTSEAPPIVPPEAVSVLRYWDTSLLRRRCMTL